MKVIFCLHRDITSTTAESDVFISTGMAVIEDHTTEEIANIKKEAVCIVHKGCVLGHFMIDKSLVEKHAIQRGKIRQPHVFFKHLLSFWPGAIIRVCQFHLIQALL